MRAGADSAPAGQLTRADLAPLADAVRAAAAARRRLAPRGAGSWWPDLPAGATPLAGAAATMSRFDPTDLVATAGAGIPLRTLAHRLAAQGAFVALDPPGAPDRTLGGVLASGGAGPLAALYGPPRDQILGMTLVAGNGTVVKTGGRVVKNVAGFDLGKAVIGAHGAFGFVAEVHLRLRALPPADATRAWSGPRDRIAAAAARLVASPGMPASIEVTDPALAAALGLPREWTLLVRALGTEAAVAEELAAAAQAALPAGCTVAVAPGDVWQRWRAAAGAPAVIVRIGADPATWPSAADLAHTHLGADTIQSATVPRGTVRAGAAHAAAAQIAALREDAARHGWPVTLERAPAALREAAGVWGALPPRVTRLAQGLRDAFDPNGVFEVPLWT